MFGGLSNANFLLYYDSANDSERGRVHRHHCRQHA